MPSFLKYSVLALLMLLIGVCSLSNKQQVRQQTLTPLVITLEFMKMETMDTLRLVFDEEAIESNALETVVTHDALLSVVADTLSDYPYAVEGSIFLRLDTMTTTNPQGQMIRYLYWVNNSGGIVETPCVDQYLAGGAEVYLNQRWQSIHHLLFLH